MIRLEPIDEPFAGDARLVELVGMTLALGLAAPWCGYLAYERETAVGTCAFVRAPVDGAVEISYYTLPELEGRGLATEMARQLNAIARENGARLVYALTLCEDNASTRILQKLGLARAGEAVDDDAGTVWRWELRLY